MRVATAGHQGRDFRAEASFRRALRRAEAFLSKQGRSPDGWKVLHPVVNRQSRRVTAFGSSVEETGRLLGAIYPKDGDAMLWTREIPQVAQIRDAVEACTQCRSQLDAIGHPPERAAGMAIWLAESHHRDLYDAYVQELLRPVPPELLEDSPLWVAAQAAAVAAAALEDPGDEVLRVAATEFLKTKVALLQRLHRRRRVAGAQGRREVERAQREQKRRAGSDKRGVRLPHSQLVWETARYLIENAEDLPSEILDRLNKEGILLPTDTMAVEHDEDAGTVHFHFADRNPRALSLKRFRNLVAAATRLISTIPESSQ